MITFIKIVAGCIVAILLLIGAAYLYFRRFLGQIFAAEDAHDATPLAIHLNEDLAPQWTAKPAAVEIKTELKSLGFVEAKAYTCPELPTLDLLSLFNGDYAAVILSIPEGCFCEITFKSSDKMEFTTSNQPYATMMEQPPHKHMVYMPSANPSQLFERIETETIGKQAVRLSDKTFRAAVEASYREDIQYANRHGGVTREQFQMVAEKSKQKFKPGQLDEAYQTFKCAEIENWNQAALDQFYKSLSNNEEESTWEFNYFIVPRVCNKQALLQYLAEMAIIDEEKIDSLQNILGDTDDGVELFCRINDGLSPSLRADHVSATTFPVNAELYRLAY